MQNGCGGATVADAMPLGQTVECKGEKYTLQLDSHHRFVKDWDDKLIKMIKGLQKDGYEKPLLRFTQIYKISTDQITCAYVAEINHHDFKKN